MTVSYEFIGLEYWDMIFPSLCITNDEIKTATKNDLNTIISMYIISTGIVNTIHDENGFLSNDLYLAIKLWAAQHKGKLVMNSRLFMNIIDIETKLPIKVLEIIYMKQDGNVENVYLLNSLNADGRKNGNMIYVNGSNIKINYDINQPVIVINKD